MPLNLGDVQTCEEYGARSEPLHDRGHRPFSEGGGLTSSWLNGPFPRHLYAGEARPTLCPWCNDLAMGFPAIVNRPHGAKGEVWEVGGPLKKYLVPPWGEEAMKPRPDPYSLPEYFSRTKPTEPAPAVSRRDACPQVQLSLFGSAQ